MAEWIIVSSSKKATTKSTPKFKIKRNRKKKKRPIGLQKNKTHDSKLKKLILKCENTSNLEICIIMLRKKKKEWNVGEIAERVGLKDLVINSVLFPG